MKTMSWSCGQPNIAGYRLLRTKLRCLFTMDSGADLPACEYRRIHCAEVRSKVLGPPLFHMKQDQNISRSQGPFRQCEVHNLFRPKGQPRSYFPRPADITAASERCMHASMQSKREAQYYCAIVKNVWRHTFVSRLLSSLISTPLRSWLASRVLLMDWSIAFPSLSALGPHAQEIPLTLLIRPLSKATKPGIASVDEIQTSICPPPFG